MQECQNGFVLSLFDLVGVVIGDAVGDDVVSDVERGGDGGSASHIGDDWLASEEAGNGEAGGAEAQICFSSLFVEFSAVDAEGGSASRAVGKSVGFANEAGEVRVVGVVFVEDDDFWVHSEKSGFVRGEVSGGGSVERGGNEVGQSGGVDGETVEDVVFERVGRSGDDDVGRAGFPSFAEEFVESGNFNRVVRCEGSDVLPGGAKNFVNKVRDDCFAGGASDADELHIANRVAIIARQELRTSTLEFRFNGRFLFRFGFLGRHSIFHHGVIIAQKSSLGESFL